MNLPNFLTSVRFILVPIFYLVYFSGHEYSFMLSMLIFFIAGLTDILDGRIARKYNLVTKWGIVLDPAADKLMSITLLYCLSKDGLIPTWIFGIFLIKEICMILGGLTLLSNKTVVSADHFGKYATLLLYLSIAVFIFNRSIGIFLLYAAIVMTISAFINYFIKFIKITNKTRSE